MQSSDYNNYNVHYALFIFLSWCEDRLKVCVNFEDLLVCGVFVWGGFVCGFFISCLVVVQ